MQSFLPFTKCIPVVVQPAQFSEVIFVGYFWRIVIDFDGNLAIIRTESFTKLQVQSQNTKGVPFLMLAEERFALILDLLARQRTATVQELCEALSASESTIRRDLNELDKLGKLNKVHGGATLPDSPFRTDEPTMAAKETLAVDQKQSIAQAAASLIQPEDFIFLDAGSTTLAVARLLSGPALKASYVTNGVAHARLLAQKGCRVFLPGGLLRPQTEAIIGAAALTALQQYNFTKAFMGANGVALEAGFTTPDPEEAAVKAAAVRRAREAWFLVDDSKFAQVYPAVITDLHSGAILTNRCPNPKYREFTLIKETEL